MTFSISSCFVFAIALTLPRRALAQLFNDVDNSHNCTRVRCRSHMGWPGHPFPADPWGLVIDPALISDAVTGANPVNPAILNSIGLSSTLVESPLSTIPPPSPSSPSNLSSSTSSEHSSHTPHITTPPRTTSTPSSPSPAAPPPSPDLRHSSASPSPSSNSSSRFASQASSTASAPPGVPSAGSGSPSGVTSPSDVQAYLSGHNGARAQHGAAPLTYSQDLAAKAQQWANGCLFQHSQGQLGPFGENLAAGTGSDFGISKAIQAWTDEASQYDPNNPQPSHFTQVVWKSTTRVGCAVQICNGILPGKANFFVCEYSPPGNVIGQFAENVQP